tara:strand:- start:83 stop:490 length:408 start_codon:yes stop_codon:yes gene_type:complete
MIALTAQINDLVEDHTAQVIKVLAEKYGFEIDEATQHVEKLVLPSKTKRKGKKKRVGKTKRIATAYIKFCNANRAQVLQDHPDMASKDVLRELGLRWKAANDDVRKPFVDAYNADKLAAAEHEQSDPNHSDREFV